MLMLLVLTFTSHPFDYIRNCVAEQGWQASDNVVCEVVDCGHPGGVSNGNRNVASTTVGSTAISVCNHGYVTASGHAVVSTCQESGIWMPDVKHCQEVLCVDTSAVGSAVIPACGSGMVRIPTQGSAYACAAFGGRHSSCASEASVCPYPSLPNADFNSVNRSAKGIARYGCARGYTMTPHVVDFIVCQSNLQWSPGPSACVTVDCLTPPNVEKATVESPYSTTYGSVVTYVCTHPYISASVVNTKECLESGVWSDGNIISCIEGPRPCPEPPEFENATVVPLTDLSIGAIAIYECNPGFEHWWFDDLECGSGSVWDDEDIVCKPKSCDIPPHFANSYYDWPDSDHIGATVSYHCISSYVLKSPKSTLTCLEVGSWSNDLIECEDERAIACPHPPEVENSTLTVISYVKQMGGAVYKCKEGYHMTNVRALASYVELDCQGDGQWVGELINCQPVDCGQPPSVANADIIPNATTVGSIISYNCLLGFRHPVANSMSKSCLSNGSWSEEVVECILDTLVHCGELPYMDDATVSFSSYFPGSEALYECNKGFQGSAALYCSNTGVWEKKTWVPCHEIDCGLPPDINDAEVFYEDTLFNYSAIYFCDVPGSGSKNEIRNRLIEADMRPVAESTCLDDRTWSLVNENACTKCDPSPPDVANGELLFIESSYIDGFAVFVCFDGYEPESDVSLVRICNPDGTWSDQEIRCRSTLCDDVPEVNFAEVVAMQPTDKTIKYTYSCLEGYRFDGGHGPTMTVECHYASGWVALRLNCEVVDCGPPPSFIGTEILGVGHRTQRKALQLVHKETHSFSAMFNSE